MSDKLARLFDVPEPGRIARLRELRAMALLLCGPRHAVTVALAAAIGDVEAIGAAVAAIDALDALPRRRLLATWAAVL